MGLIIGVCFCSYKSFFSFFFVWSWLGVFSPAKENLTLGTFGVAWGGNVHSWVGWCLSPKNRSRGTNISSWFLLLLGFNASFLQGLSILKPSKKLPTYPNTKPNRLTPLLYLGKTGKKQGKTRKTRKKGKNREKPRKTNKNGQKPPGFPFLLAKPRKNREKPPVFLCRSTVQTGEVGALRALELLGLSKHVTQLSTVAGSAWAAAAFVWLGEEREERELSFFSVFFQTNIFI